MTYNTYMENFTDLEKQALSEVMDYYVYRLYEDNCTEASIKFHSDLRDKLDLILFPQLGEYE